MIDCSTLWAQGFPDDGRQHEKLECVKFTPDRTIRLPREISIYRDLKLVGLSSYDRVELAVAKAADRSYRFYKSFWSGLKINIILYHRFHSVDEGMYAKAPLFHHHFDREACPVILYRPVEGFSNEHLSQLIAHELFHCFSFKNHKEEIAASVLDTANHWHFEGLAQFFSNLVYPASNWEYSDFFPLYVADRQLTRQPSPYRVAHFWQSYFNYIGQNAHVILNFISNLPRTVGTSAIDLFNTLPNVDKAFHRFAEEVFSFTLRDSDGSVGHPIMVGIPNEYALSQDSIQEFELRYRTLSLFSHQFKLKKGYNYRFEVELPDNESIVSLRTIENNGAYIRSPLNVSVGCEEELSVEIVATTTGLDQSLRKAKLTLTQTKGESCETCSVSNEIDQCLIGNWEVDIDSYKLMKQRLLPPLASHLDSVSGGYYMNFGDNNLLAVMYGNFNVSYSGQISGTPVTLEHIYNGLGDALYSASNGNGCTKRILNSMNVRQIITHPMGISDILLPHDFEEPSVHFIYQCSERQLKFIHSKNPRTGSGIDYELIFNRI